MKLYRAAFLWVLVLLSLSRISAFAAPVRPDGLLIVTTTDDELNGDGDCSLREAIQAANQDAPIDACPAGNGNDAIILPEGHYVLGLVGAGEDGNQTGDLDLRGNVAIVGDGAGIATIDGGGIDRVLHVSAGANVVISGVTITGGRTPDGVDSQSGGGNAEPGGGILNQGDMRLANCAIVGNRTGDGGDAGFSGDRGPGGNAGHGGGFFNSGRLEADHCVISANRAGSGGVGAQGEVIGQGGAGAGIYNQGEMLLAHCTISDNLAGTGGLAVSLPAGVGGKGGDGGGIYNSGTLIQTYSTIRSNHAGDGAGAGQKSRGGPGGNGGGVFNTGQLSLTYSTLNDNRTGNGGDAALAGSGGEGGGIANRGWMFLSNSTLSGNRSGDEGNGLVSGLGRGGAGGGILNGGTMALEFSTISHNGTGIGINPGNPDGDGGGIATSGYVELKGLLLADNSSGGNGPDCMGVIKSLGFNLIGDVHDCTVVGDLTGNLVGQNPRLAPLGDYGGETWTHALLVGSPAVDRASCAGFDGQPLATDQRGTPRPLGRACDIGAYECSFAAFYMPLLVR